MRVRAYSQSESISHFTSPDITILRRLAREKKISDVRSAGDSLSFRARQFIGIIQLSQTVVEIIPAIAEGLPMADYIFHMLDKIYQRSYKAPKIDTSSKAFLEQTTNLVEVITLLLINSLKRIQHAGLNLEYVELRGTERFLRGRIIISEQIQHLCPKPEFHCTYDNLTEDNFHNQIISYTIRRLLSVINNMTLKKKLLETLALFSEVNWRAAVGMDFGTLSYTRINQHYKPIHDICRLILENVAVENRPGFARATAFLINGNLLFEQFVAAKLNENLGDLGMIVEYQSSTNLLTPVNNSEKVTMRPDIIIYSGWRNKKPLMIIETKFQNMHVTDMFGKKKLRSMHFFQLLSYSSRLGCQGLLVYPGHLGIISPPKLEWNSMGEVSTKLGLTTIDLSARQLMGDDLVDTVLASIRSKQYEDVR